nr:hypothetical protein [uncultured Acetatifactor sp.]
MNSRKGLILSPPNLPELMAKQKCQVCAEGRGAGGDPHCQSPEYFVGLSVILC